MKKYFTLAVLLMGIVAAQAAEKVCEGFVTRSGNNNCSYGEIFSWTSKSANTMQLFKFEAGTLSNYTNLQFSMSNFVDLSLSKSATGNKVRIILLNSEGKTLKTFSFATIYSSGVTNKDIDLTQLSTDTLNAITEIAVGGSCDSAMVTLPHDSIRLISSTSVLPCEGVVKRSGNSNCKYGNRFCWTKSNANTMQIFKLEEGELLSYDSMKITLKNFIDMTAEHNVGSGQKVRIIFMDASGTALKTQQFYTIDGKEKKLNLAELLGEQRSNVAEIAIGGSCDAGSVEVDASSIQLLNSSPTSVNNINTIEKQSHKITENGHIIIIRDGVRYTVTGAICK